LKVILTRDYEKLGNAGDLIVVKDGFAKNFLLPNNIALPATSGNLKQMEIVKKSLVKKEAKNIADAEKIAELVDGMLLKFKVNSSPEGKLYGSITSKDIAEKIFDLKKVEIDRKKIDLDEHIKEVGSYDVQVKLYKEVKATIKIDVKSDNVIITGPEAAELLEAPPGDNIAGQEDKKEAPDTSTEAAGKTKNGTSGKLEEQAAGPGEIEPVKNSEPYGTETESTRPGETEADASGIDKGNAETGSLNEINN